MRTNTLSLCDQLYFYYFNYEIPFKPCFVKTAIEKYRINLSIHKFLKLSNFHFHFTRAYASTSLSTSFILNFQFRSEKNLVKTR